jgi:hypothetical protein
LIRCRLCLQRLLSATGVDVTETQRVELILSFGSPLIVGLTEVEANKPVTTRLTIWYEQFSITTEGDVMYTLGTDHLVKMQVSYVDAAGNPAKVDGVVTWASSDAALISVVVDANDSTICTATPVGPLGQVQITATADADLGSGVVPLITNCDIQIVSGTAVAGSIQPLGDPEPVAPHPAPRT